MAAVVAEQRPRPPRSEQNTPAAFLLALSMHALLLGALWISVQWHTEPAGTVVVELWGAVPPSAPAPTPEPVVVPPPAPPPPPKVEPQPEPPKPDIAVKDEKKPPPDTKKIDAEKQRAEEAKRLKAEQQQRERELEQKKAEAARAAEQKRDEERREALRKSEEARMLSQAGSPSGSTSGKAGSGGRGDAGYASLLSSLIKPRIVFAVPDGTAASVYAEFDVDLLPTGEILNVRLIRPSGLPGYDAAVERAIRRTDPFPRKPDGTVDRTIRLTFRPVEK